jgi:Transposase DDE domain
LNQTPSELNSDYSDRLLARRRFETPYQMRKQVVEPVFGQIKQARGFCQFLLRGVEKVRAEWAMICTAHNLLKLFTLANAA